MAQTERSFNPHEVDLGIDQEGNSVKGFRQSSVDLTGFSLYFTTALREAEKYGADDVGLYLLSKGLNRFVLAGWLGDQVVKSEPAPWPSDEMGRQLMQAIHDVQNAQRLARQSADR